ncbi:transposable element Tcb2 transposase [Trichonephila clavipes]|nr:transposable element Tcb2 transposase [Trichonephila clavipes]
MREANNFIDYHPGTGSTFTWGPVSSRTIRRRLAEGHLGPRRPLRVLPFTHTHRTLRLECSDDNRIVVWRPRGERLNPAFALQRHPATTAGVMVLPTIHWCAKIKDEVEKLAYQLNEEAERTERPIRRLSTVAHAQIYR